MKKRSGTQVLLRHIWLGPMFIVGASAFFLFFAGHLIDTAQHAQETGGFFHALVSWDEGVAESFFSNHLAQVIGALLALAITVVSIVVQMAATQITPRVTDLFIKEPTNFAVLAFFVVGCIHGEWVALTFRQGYIPRVGATIGMFMMSAAFLILIPYMAYVFAFLEPKSILSRMRAVTATHITDAVGNSDEGDFNEHKARAVDGVEQLADLAMNSLQQKDRDLALAALAALRTLAVEYLEGPKPKMPPAWFEISSQLRENPDFTSLSDESLSKMVERKIWLETKIFRQYQMIYNEALNKTRDVNYVVAINTRLIAEAAQRAKDVHLLELAIKVMNTYLRATLNAKDVRTAYNVFNQYRLLAEDLLRNGYWRELLQVAGHFKYYGQLAFGMGLSFITETAAYDLCTLNEVAFGIKDAPKSELLKVFLEIDKESESREQERGLRGVRKAQIKLATYYLVQGDEAQARTIFRDMAHEPFDRLRSIRQELEGIESPEYWEIIDRGTNFDYLEPQRKKMLARFFAWFDEPSQAGREALG
jgi:hypothetical protein